jgi:DNA repair exonuclease SbcCD nuclease subunit
MRELEMRAFKLALDRCVQEQVDFILICGDLFHVSIPDLSVVDEAVKKMREVGDKGIPIYAIYGSHDYSPNSTSVIDVLASAGIIKRIVDWELVGDRIKLNFFTDPKTGAKITGISARKAGLESRYFEMLDRRALEHEDGFKIFAFHAALNEFKPEYLSKMESFATTLLPKSFNYYAGGHVHDRSENSLHGYDRIVFPGALFPKDARDLERTVKGEKRGFYIVSFDDEVYSQTFLEVSVFDDIYLEYDVSDKTTTEAQKELQTKIQTAEVNGKVVLLKVSGRLSEGKTADIDFQAIRQTLLIAGAIHVELNRYGVTSREYQAITVSGQNVNEIEANLLKENISSLKTSEPALTGEQGLQLSKDLLRTLRAESQPTEAKREYESRMTKQGIETLGIKEALQ